MPHIKKAQAGSDSYGHVWDKDGAVVEVSHEESVELLAIADAGFTLVSGPGEDEEQASGAGAEFSEVDPKAGDSTGDDGEPGDAKAPAAAKKTAARKTAASKPE